MGPEDVQLRHSGIVLNMADGPAAIAEALHERGSVCIRNVLPPRAVAYAGKAVGLNSAALKRLLGKEVNDMPLCFGDRYIEGEEVPPSLYDASMQEYGDPICYSGMTRSWYYEGERNYKRWFWENGGQFPNIILRMIRDSSMSAVYRRYFGEGCVSCYQYNTVRYQRPDIKHLSYPFHQDGSYQSREKSQRCSLTTWIPFVDCGIDAPGLQLYPYRLDEVLPLPEGKRMPYLFCDEQEVVQRFGDRLWAPPMSAGDVLIFDGFTVHRTYTTEDMSRERNNADVRVYPQNRLADPVQQAVGWMLNLDER